MTEMPQKILSAKISKRNDEKKLVFGFASVVEDEEGRPVIDHQNDIIPVDEMEAAAYDFVLHSRSGDRMHKSFGVSTLVESVALTPEKREAMGLPAGPSSWWVGFKVHDDATWRQVVDGTLSEMSIFGSSESADV